MLACWSFGLIGLSQFLQCSVSFFCPNPFQRSLPCSFSPFRYATLCSITPQNILYPKQECHRSFRKLHSTSSIAFAHSVATLAQPAKNYTTRQKLRQPCRKRQPSAALISFAFFLLIRHSQIPQAPFASALISCVSFAIATFRATCCRRPLSTRNCLRLSLRQAKKSLHYVPPIFYLPPVGSRLLYLLCFSYAHFLLIRHSQIPLRSICLCSHFVRQFRFAHTQPPTTHPSKVE